MAKYYFEKWSLKWNLNSLNWGSEKNKTGTQYRILIDGTTELVDMNNLNVDDLTFRNVAAQIGLYANNQAFACERITKFASDRIYYKAITPDIRRTELLEYRIKNTLVENIVADETEFPANGILGSYWYVRGDKAFPDIKIKGVGTVESMKIKTLTGDKEVENVYLVVNGQKVELV